MLTAKERMLWEQAVRVLRQNNVTTTVAAETSKAEPVSFVKAHGRATSRGRK